MSTVAANEAAIAYANAAHAERARGWNTWDTRSILRHVLLPQGLCVSLGFAALDKLVWVDQAFFGQTELGRPTGTQLTSLDKAPPVGSFLTIRPGPHTYDGSYTELEVDLRGSRFRVRTAGAGEEWIALIEPLQNEPWPRALTVHVALAWGRAGHAVKDGPGTIAAHLPDGIKTIHATGTAFEEPNLPVLMPSLALRLDGPVTLSTGTALNPEAARRRLDLAQAPLTARFQASGALAEAHEAMQTCLAWNVIYEPRFRRVIAPVARDWNCKRGGYAVFCWDSFFTAWMIAYDDPALGYACALETLREMVDGEFVPNHAQGSGRISLDRSQPPVGSMALLGMHRRHANAKALAAAWPALLSWNRWRHAHRRNPAGTLSLGSDPFEPRVGDPAEFIQPNTGAGAAIESGLDNLPIYDGAPFDPQTHLMLTEDVGTTALYVADCEALAQIAGILGHGAEAQELQKRAKAYQSALSRLWRPETENFQDRRLDTGEWCQREAATSFYALLAGAATAEQAQRMAERHLHNPAEYGGPWMIPAIPRTDPAFPEQVYLRGRVWPPINFLIDLGLQRYGLESSRAELHAKSLELLLVNWRKERVVGENYSAITGAGGRGPHTHPLYGWGGLLAFMALPGPRAS